MVLISIVVIGTAGFYHLEKETIKDLTLTNSFYWTIVTITSVGYGHQERGGTDHNPKVDEEIEAGDSLI